MNAWPRQAVVFVCQRCCVLAGTGLALQRARLAPIGLLPATLVLVRTHAPCFLLAFTLFFTPDIPLFCPCQWPPRAQVSLIAPRVQRRMSVRGVPPSPVA
jgi:hypothetical protein